MSEWTKVKPTDPGWYWCRHKLFKDPHPFLIRIVTYTVHNCNEYKSTEYFDRNTKLWISVDSYIDLYQKIDNQPIDFSGYKNDG